MVTPAPIDVAAAAALLPRKLHIMTWGCQMNVYDSNRMADLLAPLGYGLTDDAAAADLVLLNTCHIREKASEKIFSELGRLHKKQQARAGSANPMLIGVAGCVAQAEGEQIVRRAPYVSLVVGPQTYQRLPEMVTKALRGSGALIDTDFPAEPKFDALPDTGAAQGPSAFLSVQEGCDKFCTFCVVPYTRGAEYSRPATDIIREAKRQLTQGTREITLLGQNVNAWHGDGPQGGTWNFARLLRELAELPGLARLRYTTSHPRDMDDDLVHAHGEIPSLMPFLHLPVQSGADRILEAMNRRHGRDDYLRHIDALHTARPDMAFSSDFIVGFPGETDADFAATLDLVRRVDYAQAYSFKYSPRPGTPAAVMNKTVPEAVKDTRLQELQALLGAQQRRFNDSFIGRRVDVLFDRPGRKEHQLLGRTPYMQAVHLDVGTDGAAERLGTITPVTVAGATQSSLQGQL